MLNPDKSYIMHQTIQNLSIKNKEFIRNNIQNNSFTDCVFEKINLSRSSLVNLRIKDTKFVNCIFQNVDLIGFEYFHIENTLQLILFSFLYQ